MRKTLSLLAITAVFVAESAGAQTQPQSQPVAAGETIERVTPKVNFKSSIRDDTTIGLARVGTISALICNDTENTGTIFTGREARESRLVFSIPKNSCFFVKDTYEVGTVRGPEWGGYVYFYFRD